MSAQPPFLAIIFAMSCAIEFAAGDSSIIVPAGALGSSVSIAPAGRRPKVRKPVLTAMMTSSHPS